MTAGFAITDRAVKAVADQDSYACSRQTQSSSRPMSHRYQVRRSDLGLASSSAATRFDSSSTGTKTFLSPTGGQCCVRNSGGGWFPGMAGMPLFDWATLCGCFGKTTLVPGSWFGRSGTPTRRRSGGAEDSVDEHLFTVNPLAAVLSHPAMHFAAIVHVRETTLQLPPHYGASGDES
jgi:hypothetical protein